MALVSIIIPCFNAEATLRETLASALAQTHGELEIIAVDDGSTDGTRAILESHAPRVQVVHGPNRGAAEARNSGTSLAAGEFLLYLDSDDLLEPHAAASRIAALEASGADVAYADWQKLEEREPGRFEPGEVVARRMEEVHSRPEIALFTEFWCPPAALLYRRGIVQRLGGFRQHLAPIEDARFLLDAALDGASFVHVPGVGARYRIGSGPSHSRRSKESFYRAVFRSAKEVEARWQARGPMDIDQRRAMLSVYEHCTRSFFPGNREAFREALQAIRRLEPGFRCSWPKVVGLSASLLGVRATSLALRIFRRPPG